MIRVIARLLGKDQATIEGRSDEVHPEVAALRRLGKTRAATNGVGPNVSGAFGHDDELDGEVNRSTVLRFTYLDRDGIVSEREVTDWIDTTFYVKGRCSQRRALRTFRKDQVERWISGKTALRHGTLRFGRSSF